MGPTQPPAAGTSSWHLKMQARSTRQVPFRPPTAARGPPCAWSAAARPTRPGGGPHRGGLPAAPAVPLPGAPPPPAVPTPATPDAEHAPYPDAQIPTPAPPPRPRLLFFPSLLLRAPFFPPPRPRHPLFPRSQLRHHVPPPHRPGGRVCDAGGGEAGGCSARRCCRWRPRLPRQRH